MGVLSVPQLLALHDVPRIFKRWLEKRIRIAPRVIEMQVRVNHQINVNRLEVQLTQAGKDRFIALERELRFKFLATFVVHAGFNQDVFAVQLDQQRVDAKRDAVLSVRRRQALPQYAWHRPEHRAAIQPALPVGQRVDIGRTDAQMTNPRHENSLIRYV